MDLRLCQYLEDEGDRALYLEYPSQDVYSIPVGTLSSLGLEPEDYFYLDEEGNILLRDPDNHGGGD